MNRSISRLETLGFVHCGTFHCADDFLSTQLTTNKNDNNVLYAFTIDSEVKYVGKSTKGLKKRIYFYCKPGPSQSTNIRLNKLIREMINNGKKVEIYCYFDAGKLRKGDFSINVAAGLEDGIIEALKPEWNIHKANSITPEPHIGIQIHKDSDQTSGKTEKPVVGRPHFEVRLGQAYWNNGFFNVGVDFDRYFDKHNKPINIFLGDEHSAVSGYINREANPNGTPRIMGGITMKEWIQRNAKFGGTITVEIFPDGDIRLIKTR
jgi:hypothetical protein